MTDFPKLIGFLHSQARMAGDQALATKAREDLFLEESLAQNTPTSRRWELRQVMGVVNASNWEECERMFLACADALAQAQAAQGAAAQPTLRGRLKFW